MSDELLVMGDELFQPALLRKALLAGVMGDGETLFALFAAITVSGRLTLNT